MAQQTVCDECNEPIDTTQPFFQVIVQLVTEQPGGGFIVATGGEQRQFDYHQDHLPMPHPVNEAPPATAGGSATAGADVAAAEDPSTS